MRPPCKGCPALAVTKNISGTEAHCMAKSKRGRMIRWHYGLNTRDTWYTVWGELALCQAPAWCPKNEQRRNEK